MDGNKYLKVELQTIDDMVDKLEMKIHNLIGLIELLYLGMAKLSSVDDSFELSSVSVIEDCLKAIEKTEVLRLHERLSELKGMV